MPAALQNNANNTWTNKSLLAINMRYHYTSMLINCLKRELTESSSPSMQTSQPLMHGLSEFCDKPDPNRGDIIATISLGNFLYDGEDKIADGAVDGGYFRRMRSK